MTIPDEWRTCTSRAIRAYRYMAEDQVLEIAYVKGRQVYDFPCPPEMFDRFTSAPSKGRFVQNVLRPYARARGWARAPHPWPW